MGQFRRARWGSTGVLLLLLALPGGWARGQCRGCGQSVGERAENKEISRWTLKEWLATKERNQLMDMWLALHSSANAYEFYLGADGAVVERQNDGNPATQVQAQRATLGAYASIVGLTGFYELYEGEGAQYGGLFNLRLLGNAVQSTNLTLHYGAWVRESPVTAGSLWRYPVLAGSMAFYLTKNFGFEGHYWDYQATTLDNGVSVGGFRRELSVFIDYSFLRVKISNYIESWSWSGGSPGSRSDSGLFGGLQLFL